MYILRQLPPSLDVGQVQKAASTFIDLGKGDDGIFGLRRGELQQIAAAQSALAGSRALAIRLGGEIAGLVALAQTASNAAAIRAAQAIKKRRDLHDDHCNREHPRRRDRHVVLRRATDHSASGKHY